MEILQEEQTKTMDKRPKTASEKE